MEPIDNLWQSKLGSRKSKQMDLLNKEDVKNEIKEPIRGCLNSQVMEAEFKLAQLTSTQKNKVCESKSKKKLFKCSICNFEYLQLRNLKRHILGVHVEIKNFRCSICDYKCTQKGHLTRHMLSVHDKIKPFKCSVCDYECSYKGSLKRHILSIHGNLKQYKCLMCEYRSSRIDHVKRHALTIHGEEIF